MTEAYIYEAIRTPRGRGKANGSLHGVKPVTLLTGLIGELRNRHPELDTNAIDDIVLGCVTPVGDQGADIAKTAAIASGLPDTVAGTQINRFCASALEAVNIASQKVRAGWDNLIIAGGVESMSNVEHYSTEMRKGARMGEAVFHDRLSRGRVMSQPIARFGIITGMIETAENLAKDYGITREQADEYAVMSHKRATAAWAERKFADEPAHSRRPGRYASLSAAF